MDDIEEIKKILKELAESQKDTDRRFKETDERFKDTDRRFKETDERFKATERLVKDLATNVGGLNKSIGKIPEALSLPDIEEDFVKFGINIVGVHPNVEVKRKGKTIKEVDILMPALYNGKEVVLVVETQLRYKSTQEVDKFYKFIQKGFREIFPEYSSYGVIGCLCALRYGTGLEKYIEKRGIFILKPKKKLIGIANSEKFKFKIY